MAYSPPAPRYRLSCSGSRTRAFLLRDLGLLRLNGEKFLQRRSNNAEASIPFLLRCGSPRHKAIRHDRNCKANQEAADRRKEEGDAHDHGTLAIEDAGHFGVGDPAEQYGEIADDGRY